MAVYLFGGRPQSHPPYSHRRPPERHVSSTRSLEVDHRDLKPSSPGRNQVNWTSPTLRNVSADAPRGVFSNQPDRTAQEGHHSVPRSFGPPEASTRRPREQR